MEERLKQLIGQYVDVEVELTDELNLLTDLEVNSIELMALIGDCEKEFNIRIDPKTLMDVETFGDLKEMLKELMEGHA